MSEESREMTEGKERMVREKRSFMTYEEFIEALRKAGPPRPGIRFSVPERLLVRSDLGNDNTLPPLLPPLSRRRRPLVPIDQNIPRSPPPLKHPTRNVRPMTLEECNLHNYQVRTSAGFDVTATPGAYICSQISPLELTYQDTMDLCEKLTRIAISTFNSRLKDTEGELEFVEVVKAMYQLIQRSYYYLTFKAVNLGNQETNTYQAVVQSAGDDSGFQVLRCRLKPDSDTNEVKWFWDDDELGRLGSG